MSKYLSLASGTAFALLCAMAQAQSGRDAASPHPNNDQTADQQAQNDVEGRAERPPTRYTSFDSLDARHVGYLDMEEAKDDPWLSQHFKSCDSDNNGKVTQTEYEICISVQIH